MWTSHAQNLRYDSDASVFFFWISFHLFLIMSSYHFHSSGTPVSLSGGTEAPANRNAMDNGGKQTSHHYDDGKSPIHKSISSQPAGLDVSRS